MFDKLVELVQKYAGQVAAKLNSNKEVSAIRDGMIATTPISIIGAIALIIAYFPYLDQFAPDLAAWLANSISQVSSVTIGLLTLVIIVSCAASYCEQLKLEKVYGVLVALIAFLLLSNFSYIGDVYVNGEVVKNATVYGVIPTSLFSSTGIFPCLITTLVSLRLYWFFTKKNLTIKMPDAVPPNVSNSFSSLIPFALVVLIFLVIRNLFLMTPYLYFPDFINQVLSQPLLAIGDSVGAVMIFILIQQLLWFFGIHGANVVGAVWKPLLATMALANMEAFQAGLPLPYIVSDTFWGVYSAVFNFSIPLLLVLVCKSIRAKSIGKLSIVPAMFCIHEPFIFGLPVVLNTLLFIPFIFVYLLQFIVVYLLAVVQIAPIPVVPVPWTTPLILSGFLSTNFNIMGAVIQILLIVVGCIGYYPFIKAMDKQFLQEEKKELQEGNA